MIPAPQMPQEAILKARRLADAYRTVFGLPEARSEDQRLVMEDLEGFCHAYRPCVEIANDGSGVIAPGNHKVNEGKRLAWLRIRGMLILSQQPAPQPVSVNRNPKKKGTHHG